MATISEYYAGKNILITGATGFVGKVLIEKLLRTCPDISSVYCLIRAKKGLGAEDRLTALCRDKLFDRLKAELPHFREKLKAIPGNIQEEKLGVTESDQEFLQNCIHIVFNCAATVRFDEPLRIAFEVNVLAVKKLVNLCSRFKNLEVFQHVSTAYANCERKQAIEEYIYPPPLEPLKLIDAMDWLDDDMLTTITPNLLGDKPNTYTFTKHLAETLLVNEARNLPVCIVRPSIVTAIWKEPAPGWIDNYNGPSGLYLAIGRGVIRSLNVDPNLVADVVPVDLPVNVMISAAWYTAVHKPKPNCRIYHVTSGSTNPILWGEMNPIVVNFFKRIPLESCFRRPKCHMRGANPLVNDYWVLVSHMIPAYLADLLYLLIGKKPQMVNMYSKLHKAVTSLGYFTHNQWTWTHRNVDMLREAMTEEDQQSFYMDPREIHWPTYIENYCLGTKIYLMKENLKGLPAAKAHLKKLRNIRYCFNTIIIVALWRLLIAKSSLARNSWHLIMGLVSKFLKFFKLTSAIGAS